MNHLTDTGIQAVADGEATQVERGHAGACGACAARVEERRQIDRMLKAAMGQVVLPVATANRIEAALAAGAGSGATRLRSGVRQPRWSVAAWGSLGLAAATVAAVVIVTPMVKPDRGAVSAVEILAQSANRLAAPLTAGVELLEYELVVNGVPKEMMADHGDGTYRVRQAIDHVTPGRFRFASFAPGGEPISSIAQDPSRGRRTMMFNLDGQAYRFEVSIPGRDGLSLPEMERLHMEASIAMMQASGDQVLDVVDTPEGRQYRIAVPKITAPVAGKLWDLTEARVVVRADDYRVLEFAVKGSFLKQEYSVSYKLVSREVTTSVLPDAFDVPSIPGEIVLTGEGTTLPARDAMVIALRELARVKQPR